MNVNMGRIQPLARRDLTKTKLTHKDPLAFAEFETQTAMLMRSTGGLAFTAANRSKDTTSVFKRHLDHLTDRQVESAEAQMAAYAAAQGAAVPNPLPQVINIPPGLLPVGAQPNLVQLLLNASLEELAEAGLAPIVHGDGEVHPEVQAPIQPPQEAGVVPVHVAVQAPAFAHMSNQDYKILTATLQQVQRGNTATKDEQKAFADIFHYVRTVTTETQTAKVNSIITSKMPGTTETLKPHQAFVAIMEHLRDVCQVTVVGIRSIIAHAREMTGTAMNKEDLMLLLDLCEYYQMTILDFDTMHENLHFPRPTRDEEIAFIIARIAHDVQELMIIKSDSEKELKLSYITLEQFIKNRRQSCQTDVLTVRERHLMDTGGGKMSQREQVAHANSMAMAASSSGMDQAYQHQDQQQPTVYAYRSQAACEDPDQAQYQHQCAQAQEAVAYGAAGAGSGYSSRPSIAASYSAARGQAPVTMQRQQQGQAMLAWREETPVPVPQSINQPAFAQYEHPQRYGLTQQSRAGPGDRPVNSCRAYPYCNYNTTQRGCDYVHVPRPGCNPREEEEDQRWHDAERTAGRIGGAERREVQSRGAAGGTPGGDVKRSRFA